MNIASIIGRLALALTAVLAVPAAAQAQAWPSRQPIRFVVVYPPGGASDVTARLLGAKLSESLGQSVIIENKPGANGIIAMEYVAQSAPDGYTLLMANLGPNAINPVVYKKLPYDAIKDFTPIARIGSFASFFAVTPDKPYQSMQALVAYAKANPGKLSMGGGIGISPHFIMEFVRVKSGTNMQFVPYRGAAPAMTDAISGQIQIHASAKVLLLPQIQVGKLRALVVASAKRWPELPDVPTLQEAGMDGFPPDVWYGLLAPAGTPAPVIAKLNATVNARLKAPEMQASLAKLSLDARPMTPQQFGDVLAKDMQQWADLAKQTGIKLDN